MKSAGQELRNALLRQSRNELASCIRQLQEAHDLLSHILECREDDYTNCPVITAYLDRRILMALEGPLEQRGAVMPERAWPELRLVAESILGPLDVDGRTSPQDGLPSSR